MAGLQTEFPFTLPKGLVDSDGTLHRSGTMRLATARDEMEPLRDQRVRDADDPYLTILVLSRVITSLGTLNVLQPRHIEELFAADLAFLQDFYGIINFGDPDEVAALQASFAQPEAEPESDLPAGSVEPAAEAAPTPSAPANPRASIEEVPSRIDS